MPGGEHMESNIKKITRGKIVFFCVILLFVCAFCVAVNRWVQIDKLQKFKDTYATGIESVPNYSITNSQNYVSRGKPCKEYWVIVKPGLTDKELEEVFYRIANDGDYLHTVWYYSNLSKANSGKCDIAELEETDKSKWPLIKRPE